MRKFVRGALAVVLAGLAVVPASGVTSAAATSSPLVAAPPPTLDLETFVAPGEVTIVSSNCSAAQQTFTWHTTGVATGPYAGTFDEGGRATRSNSGLVFTVTVEAAFRITSTTATVTGSKKGPATAFTCRDQGQVANSKVVEADALAYRALIRRPSDRSAWRDSGRSTMTMRTPGQLAGFSEQFFSLQTTTTRMHGRRGRKDRD